MKGKYRCVDEENEGEIQVCGRCRLMGKREKGEYRRERNEYVEGVAGNLKGGKKNEGKKMKEKK